MSIIRWSLVCWFVLGTVLASFARADDPLAKPKDPVAREHLLQGNKRYRLREFETSRAVRERLAVRSGDDLQEATRDVFALVSGVSGLPAGQ